MFHIRGIASAVSSQMKSNVRYKHILPKLPYSYDALEPIICTEIMELHHQKHHQTYINNLNAAEEQLQEAVAKNDTSKMIQLQSALKFNGGGHINHSIFWQNLTAKKTKPSRELCNLIEKQFNRMDNFRKEIMDKTIAIQGSGWGWVGYNTKSQQLQIVAMANQDPLQAATGLIPLFGIDVWEHAYYLQYKNMRPKYVEAIFDIINWDDVSKRFACCIEKKPIEPTC